MVRLPCREALFRLLAETFFRDPPAEVATGCVVCRSAVPAEGPLDILPVSPVSTSPCSRRRSGDECMSRLMIGCSIALDAGAKDLYFASAGARGARPLGAARSGVSLVHPPALIGSQAWILEASWFANGPMARAVGRISCRRRW